MGCQITTPAGRTAHRWHGDRFLGWRPELGSFEPVKNNKNKSQKQHRGGRLIGAPSFAFTRGIRPNMNTRLPIFAQTQTHNPFHSGRILIIGAQPGRTAHRLRPNIWYEKLELRNTNWFEHSRDTIRTKMHRGNSSIAKCKLVCVIVSPGKTPHTTKRAKHDTASVTNACAQ